MIKVISNLQVILDTRREKLADMAILSEKISDIVMDCLVCLDYGDDMMGDIVGILLTLMRF